MMDIEF